MVVDFGRETDVLVPKSSEQGYFECQISTTTVVLKTEIDLVIMSVRTYRQIRI